MRGARFGLAALRFAARRRIATHLRPTPLVASNWLSGANDAPVANDDEIPEAVQGQPVTVPVLENDVNPFPDTPLNIVKATAGNGGTAQVQGENIVVTPGAGFSGTMNVEYTVEDKTKEGSRQASANISLVVKGRPEAPTTPLVDSVRDQTVVLSWGAPADNGDPITNYRVTGTGGFSQDCPTTTCTLTGLTNDVEYTFTVVAENSVGESDASAESAVARPDVRPEAPAAPQLKFGDKSLDISWEPPVNEGSAIESYTLEISPAPPSGQLQKTGLTGTAYTWEGLENGQAYEVRVQAHNKAPEPSEFSPYSAKEVPAGPPAAAVDAERRRPTWPQRLPRTRQRRELRAEIVIAAARHAANGRGWHAY